MKNLLMWLGVFAIMWGTPALADEKVLTDKLLDSITAGSGGDAAQQSLSGNSIDTQLIDPDVQSRIDNENAQALNILNAPNENINNSIDASQNVNSKNKILVLKGDAQKNTKAVNIVNSIESQIGNGLNVHVNGLRPDSSSGGSLNNLYQTNIINQNRNN